MYSPEEQFSDTNVVSSDTADMANTPSAAASSIGPTYPFDPPFRLTDTLILATLKQEPMNGYFLQRVVHRMAFGRAATGLGSMYKTLARLEREGLIYTDDPVGARSREYDITEDGKIQLGHDLMLLRRVLSRHHKHLLL